MLRMVTDKFMELIKILDKDPSFSLLSKYSKRALALRILGGFRRHLTSQKSCKLINEYCLYTEKKPFMISKPKDDSYNIFITNITDSHIKLLIEHDHYKYYLLLSKCDFLDIVNDV